MANLSSPKKKGLSSLQQFILSLAREQGGMVMARDIFVHYYGFKPNRSPNGLRPGALVFRKNDIGLARYNAATVAVCKAFNRICERGLATRIMSGIRVF